jgi:hypothetical protein
MMYYFLVGDILTSVFLGRSTVPRKSGIAKVARWGYFGDIDRNSGAVFAVIDKFCRLLHQDFKLQVSIDQKFEV